jgi:hypothetical protein
MDGSECGVFSPSSPSSVPAVLAVKGIAPERRSPPAAVPGRSCAPGGLCLRRGLSKPLDSLVFTVQIPVCAVDDPRILRKRP